MDHNSCIHWENCSKAAWPFLQLWGQCTLMATEVWLSQAAGTALLRMVGKRVLGVMHDVLWSLLCINLEGTSRWSSAWGVFGKNRRWRILWAVRHCSKLMALQGVRVCLLSNVFVFFQSIRFDRWRQLAVSNTSGDIFCPSHPVSCVSVSQCTCAFCKSSVSLLSCGSTVSELGFG